MEIICRLGRDERWLVMLRPTRLDWVLIVLRWPRDNVEAESRRALETLPQMGEDKGAPTREHRRP
jgi:hypothetical protein